MQAKDKAKELVDGFYYTISDIPEYNRDERAKQCALICVNEILSFLMDRFSIGYWQEVKQEINRL